MNDNFYKELIVKYIEEFGSAARKELIQLLIDKLPSSLSKNTKINKIRYLLDVLKKENRIYFDWNEKNWKIK